MSTNIITLLSGVLIITTGVILTGAGVALGVQSAFPMVPPWVFFMLIGILALAVGLGLIYYGKERTKKTVERKLTMKDLFENHTLLMMSVTVGTGLVLGFLSKRARASRRVVAEAKEQLKEFAEAGMNEVEKGKHPIRDTIQQVALTGALQTLSAGLQIIAVPLMEKMLASFLHGKDGSQTEHNGEQSPEDQERYSRFNGAHR